MTFPKPHFVDSNGLRMAVYEQGEGYPIILCHGFPEIAYSWRQQIPALAKAGFRAIAPDQRGYGETVGPKGKHNVSLYDIEHLMNDLIGMLDALNIEKAVFCGHDWGGLVVWQLPLWHHERVAGIIGVNTPFLPRSSTDPIVGMRRAFGDDMYIVYFQDYGVAEKLFEADIARSMRFWYRKSGEKNKNPSKPMKDDKNSASLAFAKMYQAPEDTWGGVPVMTADELDVYIKAYQKSGYEGPVNWYRNFSRNWEKSAHLEQKITVPCLMISAADDAVLSPAMAEGMENYIPDLEKHVINNCGHWTQQEQPEQLSNIMVDWLQRRFQS